MMYVRIFAAAAAALILSFASNSSETVTIDFNSESAGFKADGYLTDDTPLVTFNSLGGTLIVGTYSGGQSDGPALSTNAGAIELVFSTAVTSLTVFFGNDDPCCSFNGDFARLTTFNNGSLFATSDTLFNRDDLLNQSATVTAGPGASFTSAQFDYFSKFGGASSVATVMDNVTFTTAPAVPEPSTWMLLLAGFAITGFALKRRNSDVGTGLA